MVGNCMCNEAGVLIFSCSGASDVGELSDKVARKMAQCGQAKMFCLSGIGAHVPGMIESTKAALKIVAIDGCPVSCAKKHSNMLVLRLWRLILRSWGLKKAKQKSMRNPLNKPC